MDNFVIFHITWWFWRHEIWSSSTRICAKMSNQYLHLYFLKKIVKVRKFKLKMEAIITLQQMDYQTIYVYWTAALRSSWLWTLTSWKACKLSHTFVPLIRDTCRSDVSPPKMTKTFRAPSQRGIDLLSFENFDLLGTWPNIPLTDARFGNREQAWWIMLLRIFVWEKPT